MAPTLFHSALETPYGTMHIAVDADGIVNEVWLPKRGPTHVTMGALPRTAREGTEAARAQLSEYFRGKRREFDVPIAPHGTAFERAVWELLRAIPYGETTSYGAISKQLNLVNGARAVGRANGANPIPIIIPCHRVIGEDGTLTGFGGGLPLKRALLELEGSINPLFAPHTHFA